MTAHVHRDTHRVRACVGRPGIWVNCHGEWCRPLWVRLYRGAWRVGCWPCLSGIDSGNDLWDRGFASLGDAFEAAMAHCASCSATVTPVTFAAVA